MSYVNDPCTDHPTIYHPTLGEVPAVNCAAPGPGHQQVSIARRDSDGEGFSVLPRALRGPEPSSRPYVNLDNPGRYEASIDGNRPSRSPRRKYIMPFHKIFKESPDS